MGYEAYLIEVRLKNNPPICDLVNYLINLGANVIEDNEYGDIVLELLYNEGIVEILVSKPKNRREKLLSMYYKYKYVIKSKKDSIISDKTIIYIRFAKPNALNLVDRIIAFLINLDKKFEIDSIIDLNAKKLVKLDDYQDLKKRVKEAKDDFERNFPGILYPIRCKDVFSMWQDMQKTHGLD